MKTITVTGHRPSRLNNAYAITHPINIQMGRAMRAFILEQAGYDKSTNTFNGDTPIRLVSGMALGADTIWALVAIKLKREYPGVFELESAIPCANHSSKWSKEDRERYNHILNHADVIKHVSKLPYKGWLMQKRNEYMVDISSTVFAIWDGLESGGTYNCIKYAMKKEREIFKYFPLTDQTWEQYVYTIEAKEEDLFSAFKNARKLESEKF